MSKNNRKIYNYKIMMIFMCKMVILKQIEWLFVLELIIKLRYSNPKCGYHCRYFCDLFKKPFSLFWFYWPFRYTFVIFLLFHGFICPRPNCNMYYLRELVNFILYPKHKGLHIIYLTLLIRLIISWYTACKNI